MIRKAMEQLCRKTGIEVSPHRYVPAEIVIEQGDVVDMKIMTSAN